MFFRLWSRPSHALRWVMRWAGLGPESCLDVELAGRGRLSASEHFASSSSDFIWWAGPRWDALSKLVDCWSSSLLRVTSSSARFALAWASTRRCSHTSWCSSLHMTIAAFVRVAMAPVRTGVDSSADVWLTASILSATVSIVVVGVSGALKAPAVRCDSGARF